MDRDYVTDYDTTYQNTSSVMCTTPYLAELAQYDQHVVWRYEHTGRTKPAKPPYNPRTGKKASVSDSSTWGSWEDASAVIEGRYEGRGFVLTQDDPFVALDLDGCLDEYGLFNHSDVDAIVEMFNSYTEVSPSGTGLRIVIKGEWPDELGNRIKGKWGGNLEIYGSDRYVTLTGEVYGPPKPIRAAQPELDYWSKRFQKFAKENKENQENNGPTTETTDVTDHRQGSRQAATTQSPPFMDRGTIDSTHHDQITNAILTSTNSLTSLTSLNNLDQWFSPIEPIEPQVTYHTPTCVIAVEHYDKADYGLDTSLLRIPKEVTRKERWVYHAVAGIATYYLSRGMSMSTVMYHIALGRDMVCRQLAEDGHSMDRKTVADILVRLFTRTGQLQQWTDGEDIKLGAFTYRINLERKQIDLNTLGAPFTPTTLYLRGIHLSGAPDSRAQGALNWAMTNVEMGNRNQIGNWLAHKLREIGLTYDQAKAMMTEYQQSVPQDGHSYTHGEALQTLASNYRLIPTIPTTHTSHTTPTTPAQSQRDSHTPQRDSQQDSQDPQDPRCTHFDGERHYGWVENGGYMRFKTEGKSFTELVIGRQNVLRDAREQGDWGLYSHIDEAIDALTPDDAVKPASWKSEDWQWAYQGYVRRRYTKRYVEVV